jgi:hypothetical protein
LHPLTSAEAFLELTANIFGGSTDAILLHGCSMLVQPQVTGHGVCREALFNAC